MEDFDRSAVKIEGLIFADSIRKLPTGSGHGFHGRLISQNLLVSHLALCQQCSAPRIRKALAKLRNGHGRGGVLLGC